MAETTTAKPDPRTLPPLFAAVFAPPYDDRYRGGWQVDRHGQTWSVATDGRTLLALKGCYGLPTDAEWAGKVADVLASAPTGPPLLLADVATLRDWLGVEKPPVTVECFNCLGEGKCTCDCCHVEHSCGCCDGAGSVLEWGKIEPVLVHGVRLDDARLARALSVVAGPCTLAVCRSLQVDKNKTVPVLRVTGAGWEVLVAALAGPEPDEYPPPRQFPRQEP